MAKRKKPKKPNVQKHCKNMNYDEATFVEISRDFCNSAHDTLIMNTSIPKDQIVFTTLQKPASL